MLALVIAAVRVDGRPPAISSFTAPLKHERDNRTVRYDWLAHPLFDSIEEVQDQATQWLWNYKHERPNMALGGVTAKQKLRSPPDLDF